jgi:hypothetical protein
MTSDITAGSPADRGAALAPVAPAAIVRTLVRPLTNVLNLLMVRVAGRRFFPMADYSASKAAHAAVAARIIAALTTGQTNVFPDDVSVSAGSVYLSD